MSLPQPLYLDASATSPPADEVLEVMQAVYRSAWGNPSSLHGFGLTAAEQLERDRQELAAMLGADALRARIDVRREPRDPTLTLRGHGLSWGRLETRQPGQRHS